MKMFISHTSGRSQDLSILFGYLLRLKRLDIKYILRDETEETRREHYVLVPLSGVFQRSMKGSVGVQKVATDLMSIEFGN